MLECVCRLPGVMVRHRGRGNVLECVYRLTGVMVRHRGRGNVLECVCRHLATLRES